MVYIKTEYNFSTPWGGSIYVNLWWVDFLLTPWFWLLEELAPEWLFNMYMALHFPDLDFINPLIEDFDLLDFFAENEYNPVAWCADIFAAQLSEWDPTY